MRLKIVSDGTSVGTRLYDADTGEEVSLEGVIGITWDISSRSQGGVATITVEHRRVEADVAGEREEAA